MADVQIGQTLYAPSRRGGGYEEFKVEKIGRKWIALDRDYRCSIDKLLLDCGGYSPRQLYTDKEAHAAESRLNAAWRDLRTDLSSKYAIPKGMTVETINEARRLLGLEVLAVSQPAKQQGG